jgi:hypothetical protein
MLIIGRLVNGLGAGHLTAVFPVYASEIGELRFCLEARLELEFELKFELGLLNG